MAYAAIFCCIQAEHGADGLGISSRKAVVEDTHVHIYCTRSIEESLCEYVLYIRLYASFMLSYTHTVYTLHDAS